MPPAAAAMGSTAWRPVASSPTSTSRFISRPTVKKNTAMNPSSIQSSRGLLRVQGPRPMVAGAFQTWS